MKKTFFGSVAVTAALMLGSPAFACGGNQCDSSGAMGNMVSVNLAGVTLGDGQVGAVAEGDSVFTSATAEKLGSLDLITELYGADDGCEADCGTTGGLFYGFGQEWIGTYGLAQAEGANSAVAGVANTQNAAIGLAGEILRGQAPASGDSSN